MSKNTSKYYQLEHAFWTLPKTRELVKKGTGSTYVYLYLLSNPNNNRIGLYELAFDQMSKHTGMMQESCLHAIDDLENMQLCTFDYDSQFIWLPEILASALRKNPSEKQLIGLHKEILRLDYEEKPFVYDAYEYCVENSEKFKSLFVPNEEPEADDHPF